ncbi:MAG: 50S ribosomal protein L25 [Parcubacteria group bacterium CG11_big_fil_rev_8_21_14_0_20_39_14]|nr:MAG: 50S ribosomal protein L25 [Parcubacteria group bacterium CG11_big_fil_rev_8_21_14_0_20_39_14]PIS35788.1 MAG: 50S ribosomal protein L25 [Parcubacteria group bacterium CG08_land_8_20_14_0_20_38_56]
MYILEVKLRQITGKKVKSLRESGVLPAVLYGPKIKKALALEVDYEKFKELYQKVGESSLIKLKIDESHTIETKMRDKEEKDVLIRGVQKDVLSDKFLHADFYEVLMTEKIKLTVPLKFRGSSEAVKSLGGILIKNITELEIEALPGDIPKELNVDLSKLETFEDNIKVKDIEVSPEVKIIAGPEEIVVLVAPPRAEEELKELEEKPEERVKEVEKVEFPSSKAATASSEPGGN